MASNGYVGLHTAATGDEDPLHTLCQGEAVCGGQFGRDERRSQGQQFRPFDGQYDSLDRVTWQKYPADNANHVGEQVNYTYAPAGAVETVGGVHYLLTDHLGSTAITTNASGGREAEMRYYPYGQTRHRYIQV